MAQIKGLTTKEAKELLIRYGPNEIKSTKKSNWMAKVKHIFKEPIYLLLAASAVIYFILGEMTDGILMIGFVFFVIGIDVLQETRTGNVLKKLKNLSQPKIKVIRDGNEINIRSEELVPGDVMQISEGVKIPADGWLIKANGLCIDESILTGESEGIWKHSKEQAMLFEDEERMFLRNAYCYTGTQVILGNGTVLVEKTGNNTEYGKIANTIKDAPLETSLLQKQLTTLANQLTKIAGLLLMLVGIVTFLNLKNESIQQRMIESILAGVVLALSMVPGEFPVIQSVFLSMGALRLAKKHALIRRLSAVETLGAVSVLCVDKTGTITKNKMEVVEFWHPDFSGNGLCHAVALSCKEDTYDPMEIAMLSHCGVRCHKGRLESDCLKSCIRTNTQGKIIKEYAFTNELKAMGQVWQFDEEPIIAVKGSTETILPLCIMTKDQEKNVISKIIELSQRGLRVIAVAERRLKEGERIPESLLECSLYLKGIIGLEDPPRENIKEQIKACYQAGIRIIMITGDHPVTAVSVAKNIGIHNCDRVMIGNEISKLSDHKLKEEVKTCNLFARVLPIHKMRIVKALKENGEITAMTGDGVNDAPALKIANIGVAMGMHGSEVSREAADLILLDDNLQTILDSVRDGRRIYANIVKAIGYVLTIHIPIALISLMAPLLGISKEALMLLPLHIVLMELVMDPTCSVALERLPAEENTMKRPPRKPQEKLLTVDLLMKSLLQGLAIFLASFGLYYGLLSTGYPSEIARTAGYSILILSNILLVLTNCSETESIYRIFAKIKSEKGIWFVNAITILELIIIVYTPAAKYLQLAPMSIPLLFIVISLSCISVLWYEAVKLWKRKKS